VDARHEAGHDEFIHFNYLCHGRACPGHPRIWRLIPVLGRGLPSDEDLLTWCDEARNETLRAWDKEFVEARIEHRTEPPFEIISQRPKRPLVTAKTCHPRSDRRFTCGGWDDGSGGRQRQDPDIRQNALFPKHIGELDMPGNHFLDLLVHELEENALPGWWGRLLTVIRTRRLAARSSLSTNCLISRVR
jgi:hypothetical protein